MADGSREQLSIDVVVQDEVSKELARIRTNLGTFVGAAEGAFGDAAKAAEGVPAALTLAGPAVQALTGSVTEFGGWSRKVFQEAVNQTDSFAAAAKIAADAISSGLTFDRESLALRVQIAERTEQIANLIGDENAARRAGLTVAQAKAALIDGSLAEELDSLKRRAESEKLSTEAVADRVREMELAAQLDKDALGLAQKRAAIDRGSETRRTLEAAHADVLDGLDAELAKIEQVRKAKEDAARAAVAAGTLEADSLNEILSLYDQRAAKDVSAAQEKASQGLDQAAKAGGELDRIFGGLIRKSPYVLGADLLARVAGFRNLMDATNKVLDSLAESVTDFGKDIAEAFDPGIAKAREARDAFEEVITAIRAEDARKQGLSEIPVGFGKTVDQFRANLLRFKEGSEEYKAAARAIDDADKLAKSAQARIVTSAGVRFRDPAVFGSQREGETEALREQKAIVADLAKTLGDLAKAQDAALFGVPSQIQENLGFWRSYREEIEGPLLSAILDAKDITKGLTDEFDQQRTVLGLAADDAEVYTAQQRALADASSKGTELSREQLQAIEDSVRGAQDRRAAVESMAKTDADYQAQLERTAIAQEEWNKHLQRGRELSEEWSRDDRLAKSLASLVPAFALAGKAAAEFAVNQKHHELDLDEQERIAQLIGQTSDAYLTQAGALESLRGVERERLVDLVRLHKATGDELILFDEVTKAMQDRAAQTEALRSAADVEHEKLLTGALQEARRELDAGIVSTDQYTARIRELTEAALAGADAFGIGFTAGVRDAATELRDSFTLAAQTGHDTILGLRDDSARALVDIVGHGKDAQEELKGVLVNVGDTLATGLFKQGIGGLIGLALPGTKAILDDKKDGGLAVAGASLQKAALDLSAAAGFLHGGPAPLALPPGAPTADVGTLPGIGQASGPGTGPEKGLGLQAAGTTLQRAGADLIAAAAALHGGAPTPSVAPPPGAPPTIELPPGAPTAPETGGGTGDNTGGTAGDTLEKGASAAAGQIASAGAQLGAVVAASGDNFSGALTGALTGLLAQIAATQAVGALGLAKGGVVAGDIVPFQQAALGGLYTHPSFLQVAEKPGMRELVAPLKHGALHADLVRNSDGSMGASVSVRGARVPVMFDGDAPPERLGGGGSSGGGRRGSSGGRGGGNTYQTVQRVNAPITVNVSSPDPSKAGESVLKELPKIMDGITTAIVRGRHQPLIGAIRGVGT